MAEKIEEEKKKKIIFPPYQYPYCEFKFIEWNPVQEKCYPFFTQDNNLVVSSSTASGKTVIAEAIMGYELQKNINNKVIYVSPLKAIGIEKFQNWNKHPTFKEISKILVSSDQNVNQSDFQNSRMIISTIESMNIRCRARDKWIENVKLLVFDQAHLINDKSRGAGSESMIMSITQLNPDCRIVCLSGTMSNYIEIAKWLKICNNKTTRYVNSSWRPCELIKRIEMAQDYEQEKNKILNIIKEKPEEEQKILIFVHSKAIGQKLCNFLKDYGIYCAFYHANLNAKIKSRMIADFKSEYSSLNVLICTSSLGAGIDI